MKKFSYSRRRVKPLNQKVDTDKAARPIRIDTLDDAQVIAESLIRRQSIEALPRHPDGPTPPEWNAVEDYARLQFEVSRRAHRVIRPTKHIRDIIPDALQRFVDQARRERGRK